MKKLVLSLTLLASSVSISEAIHPETLSGMIADRATKCKPNTWTGYGKDVRLCKDDGVWHKPDGNILFLVAGQTATTEKTNVFVACESDVITPATAIGRINLRVGEYNFYGNLLDIKGQYFVLCDKNY